MLLVEGRMPAPSEKWATVDLPYCTKYFRYSPLIDLLQRDHFKVEWYFIYFSCSGCYALVRLPPPAAPSASRVCSLSSSLVPLRSRSSVDFADYSMSAESGTIGMRQSLDVTPTQDLHPICL